MYIRRFHFERKKDVSGVSGLGIVAVGVVFGDTGEAVLHWLGEHSSATIYHNLLDLVHIHSHGGSTEIVWDDENKNDTELGRKS
jgi:hypothetical protein